MSLAARIIGSRAATLGGVAHNTAPVVNVGADQEITLPAGATIDATVTDDGLGAGMLAVQWTTESGPASASFAPDATTVDVTVTFPVEGTYIIRLAATDGILAGSDELTVTVNPVGAGYGSQVVAAGYDHHWVPPASGSVFGDTIGSLNGTVAGTVGIDGLLSEAGGFSVGCKGGGSPGHIAFTDLLAGATVVSVGGHDQLDQLPAATTKYTLYAAASGHISVEVLEDGSIRYFSYDGAAFVTYLGDAPGQVPIGTTFRWDYRRTATGGQEVYIDGVLLAATLSAGTPPGSWPGLPAGTSTFGVWYNQSSSPMRGLIGNHQAAASAINPSVFAALAAFNQDVVWLGDVDFGAIDPEIAGSFDPAPEMHPITGTTVAVDTQPAGATVITADGALFDWSTVGAAAGADSFTGHAVRGISSRIATLSFSVNATGGGGGEDPPTVVPDLTAPLFSANASGGVNTNARLHSANASGAVDTNSPLFGAKDA